MILDVSIGKSLGRFALEAGFTVQADRVTALFGPSGSGKSTIVRAIAGILRPDRGHIRVAGTTFFDAAQRINLPPEHRRVGYVFQDSKLFPHLKVRDNLLYGQRRAPVAERRISLDEVVEPLGIGHLLDRRPHALSGGERQRVALGRALLAQPRILLMDEPLASLDTRRRLDILPFVEHVRDEVGIPIVYVSHALDEVVRLADVLVVVTDGQVTTAGPLVTVMNRPELRPVLGPQGFGTVLEAWVREHDDRHGLTVVATPGGHLRVPRLDAAPGGRVRVRICARDAAIQLDPPQNSSVINVLRGRILEVMRDTNTTATVRIDLDGAELLSELTCLSVERLRLAPELPVYVMIHALTLDRGGSGGPGRPSDPASRSDGVALAEAAAVTGHG